MMDQARLIYDVSELNSLFKESVSLQKLLTKTVELVARHMNSDVCSIYLYNEQNKELTLKATKGLNPDAVDHVKLKIGEGIIGHALAKADAVHEELAHTSPHYKYFPGIYEEKFETYLAVPIMRGVNRIGALALQRQKGNPFHHEDIAALKAVSVQLANIIENARFIMAMHAEHDESEPIENSLEKVKFIHGKVASEGFALGPAIIWDQKKNITFLFKHQFHEKYTFEDFDKAVQKTSSQLESLQETVEEKLSDAASFIFAAHLLLLKDKQFIGAMKNLIKNNVNPPQAVLEISKVFIESLATSSNAYMREKVHDVQDLVVRLLSNLVSEIEEISKCDSRIVVAREIFPSDLLKLSSENAAGIILATGGVTSHLSILARSLRIPMLITKNWDILKVPEMTLILLDGVTGNIYLNPDGNIIGKFENQLRSHLSPATETIEPLPETKTKDAAPIRLLANINLLSDLALAEKFPTQGVGLYRTEFPFMIRSNFPTEQEQYTTYRKLVEAMRGKTVTFRTLDIGGDKVLSYYHDVQEQNPALGMRSIRFSLSRQPVFREQLRAILRAGVDADLKIMFPMISSLEEFQQAGDIVRNCIQQLCVEDVPCCKKPALGMMVELPSVVEIIDEFANQADFFSIGTNDFIQFMLAVDRTNDTIADYYLPYHPSVLRSLKRIADAANSRGKEVSVCGDMARLPQYTEFLLGIGIHTLSIDPAYLPRIQQKIAQINLKQAEVFAAALLAETSIKKIKEIMDHQSQ